METIITKENLDKLLELGKISQEEYKRLARLQAIMMAEKKPTEFIYDELEAIKEKFADIVENTKSIKDIKVPKIKVVAGEKGEKGDSIVGPMGKQGPVGPAGKDGKTPVAGKDFPLPKNGKDGADGKDGKSIVGEKGDKPDHKWEGTKLKFEKPDGSWGKAIDLKGKDGKSGSSFFGGGLFSVATDSTLSGDGTLNNPLSVQSAGASSFTSLTDVPSSYTGQGTKFVRVNGAETALEFATVSGGGDALTSAPLSQFAATTSLQLKGVISDETGSGALVFADTPNLVTPVLGAATGTSLQLSGLTASELLSTDASKNLTSLAVATYPSLAEIAYVKGVTSAIQTQLNAKQATLVSGTNIKTINGTSLLGSGDITIAGTIDGSGTANELAYWTDSDTLGTLAVATYPSLTELSYIKGLTSAVQTQINTKAPSTSPTFATSITGSYLTASEILITDGSKNIVSAAVATYPSLTELTYLKGVTSAIQTQINTKANSSGALTQFVGNGNYKVFYSDGSGDITELALGADGTFLKSNGASSAPSFATPTGSGDVSKVGTPVNNQIGVWTGDGTLEGDAALTFDTTTDTLATTLITATTVTAALVGNVTGNVSGTAATVTTAAQPAITSVGTLTTLTVDNININGNTIISTDTDGNINLTPNGTGKNVLANAQVTSLTASEIVITDASKNLVSAAVATYPSLTELTYLKGVTSAIQTQLGNKQPLDSDLTTIAGLTATSDNFLQAKSSAWASRTPTQVTADLIAFVGDSGSGGTKGLVPAPTTGDATKFLKGDGTWATVSGGGITVGTTTITSGTNTRILYNNSGVVGEYTLTGTGTVVVMQNTPTLTTPVINGVSTGTGVSNTATVSTLALRNSSANLLANNFSENYTSTATTGGTTTLVVGDAGMMAFTGTSTQDINLPVTSTLTVGHKYKIVNKSTISVRVLSSGGNTMAMVGPQQTLVFTCISTSGTSGTSWHFDAGFRWYELANGTNANQITVGNYGSGIAGALGNVGTSGRDFLISAPASSGSLILNTNSTNRVTILSTGQTGFGQSTPTATIHLKAGTTAASTAPLKFTSGSLMSTAEAGAVEFLTDAFYGTITTGAARKTFAFLESPAFITPNLGTPSAGTLTNCTGLPVAGITASTSTALGVGSIELGHASDTTISRSAAGVIAVESVVIPSISSTNTLTNKRITKRTGTTTSSATPTINTDNVDFYSITAQTADITSFTTNLSGTPTEGQTLWIAITGTAARAITWGSSFEASTIALPTTTVTTNRLDVGFVYNTVTSKWRCTAAC